MPTKTIFIKATRTINQLLTLQVLTSKEEAELYIRRIPPEALSAIEDFDAKEPECGHWGENPCEWCERPRQYWVIPPAAWCWFVPVAEWHSDICMDCFCSLPGAGDWLGWIKENNPDALVLPDPSYMKEAIRQYDDRQLQAIGGAT